MDNAFKRLSPLVLPKSKHYKSFSTKDINDIRYPAVLWYPDLNMSKKFDQGQFL